MSATAATFEPIPAPEPPQRIRLTPRAWVRENLFSSVGNTLLTVAFGALLAYVTFRTARYLFVTGRWEVVRVNLRQFVLEAFPRDQLVRPWVGLYIAAASIGIGAGVSARAADLARRAAGEDEPPELAWYRRLALGWPLVLLAVVIAVLVSTLLPLVLLAGVPLTVLGARALGRRVPPRAAPAAVTGVVAGLLASVASVTAFGGVGWHRWGGLLLTLFLAVGGIALSFPLGIALALGRRSSLPAVRAASVAYIELVRGVPLVTLLFMGAFMLALFLPPGTRAPSLPTRALIVIVVFTAAYIAEVVRGGLQSVPDGQTEAANALGLRPVAVLRLIVLPQALRNVIPALVGQFISLFKDTSLVVTIGLTELLGVARQVVVQPRFSGRGLLPETLAFAALIYWVGSYTMSRASQRLEQRLGVGQR